MTGRYRTSLDHLARARKVIPDGAQEFTKFHSPWTVGAGPLFYERAEGAHIWDADGRKYLDFMMALGPLGLGYRHPEVEEAIKRQLEKGVTTSLPSMLEADLAERLVGTFPGAEMVRFGKNGSDATAAAVRIARVFTGREVVLGCGYHGWHDWCLVIADWRKDWLEGVPSVMQQIADPFEYDDLPALEQALQTHQGNVAAIIMEPTNVDIPAEGYLAEVRRLADAHGVVLIFDDMLNAYRLAFGGSAELFGVTPDLITAAKTLGNGMPISCVMGRADVMRRAQDIIFSGSFLSESLAFAAAVATHEVYRREKVVEHMWRLGEKMLVGTNALIAKHGLEGRCRGHGWPVHFILLFSEQADRERFQSEAHGRDVLFSGAHFMSFAHTDADVEHALQVYDECFAAVAGQSP